MNKALFLDRDGVINKNFGHVHKIKNFKFRKGIFELVKFFQNKKYLLIVITNQAGIGNGLYSVDDFLKLNEFMYKKFQNKGISILNTYYCPHKIIDNCSCRKPKPGLIFKALNEYNIIAKESIFIGDKKSDEIAALSSNIGKFINVNVYKNLTILLNTIKKRGI